VLPRQDFRGNHEGALRPAFNHGRKGKQSHNGFPQANIALQQAQHARWRSHVGLDFRIGKGLPIGQLIGQGANDLGLPIPAAHKASPRRPLHVPTHQTEGQLVRK